MGLGNRGQEKARGKATRKTKMVMLLSLEGNNKTEKNYFSNFKDNKKFAINFSNGNYTDPVNMAHALIEDSRYETLDFKRGDKAYCIFDTDVDPLKQVEIDKAISICSPKHAEVILSNPCFEIWFLCHFTNSTKHYSTNDELLKVLKRIIPGYDKHVDIFDKIKNNTSIAITNSKQLDDHHLSIGKMPRTMDCNPSTEVYKIVEILIIY